METGKIGVGVITHNRPHFLKKCADSIPSDMVDSVIIVNDGKTMDQLLFNESIGDDEWEWYETDGSIGVGKSKNIALRYLLDEGCDHLFLIEDDIYIKDPTVFLRYIVAAKMSGIHHLNFSQHGHMNKIGGTTPNPQAVVSYGDGVCVALYPNCVGAFTYYSRESLEDVGLFDERYYNSFEHIDHTLMMANAKWHPPFWYFADIDHSWEYLGDAEWSKKQSTIASLPNHIDILSNASSVFEEKWGMLTRNIPKVNVDVLKEELHNLCN